MAEREKNVQPLDPIPEDIVSEILLRLPARSVARFVCLSKLYATIIRSREFTRSYSKKQPRLLFAFNTEIKGWQENWFFFSKSTLVSTPLCPCKPEPGPPVSPNRFAALWRARVARNRNASRDGHRIRLNLKALLREEEERKALVVEEEEEEPKALTVEEPPDFVSTTVCHLKKLRYRKPSYVHGLMSLLYGEEQVIINPTTGKSITLPAVQSSDMIVRSFLGYDPIGARYKVLCLTNVTRFCQHHVLTLEAPNSSSWRMIQCTTPHYPGDSSVCIDGVLYYSASTSFTMKEPFLLGFDLRSENLDVASVFPKGLESSNGTALINYRGKVALVPDKHYGGHQFNIWVLEDAKKQEWSKQRICIHTGVTGKFHDHLEILGASDMGELIFAPINFKELVVYFLDHKSNRIRCVELEGNTMYKFRDFNKVFTFLHYVESDMFT